MNVKLLNYFSKNTITYISNISIDMVIFNFDILIPYMFKSLIIVTHDGLSHYSTAKSSY